MAPPQPEKKGRLCAACTARSHEEREEELIPVLIASHLLPADTNSGANPQTSSPLKSCPLHPGLRSMCLPKNWPTFPEGCLIVKSLSHQISKTCQRPLLITSRLLPADTNSGANPQTSSPLKSCALHPGVRTVRRTFLEGCLTVKSMNHQIGKKIPDNPA